MKSGKGLVDVGLLMAGAGILWLGKSSYQLYQHFNGVLDPEVRGYTEAIQYAQLSYYLLPMSLLVVAIGLIVIGHLITGTAQSSAANTRP